MPPAPVIDRAARAEIAFHLRGHRPVLLAPGGAPRLAMDAAPKRRARDAEPITANECLEVVRAMLSGLEAGEADQLRQGLGELIAEGGSDGAGPDVDGGTNGGMVQNLPRRAQDRLAADRRRPALTSAQTSDFHRRHPGAARITAM